MLTQKLNTLKELPNLRKEVAGLLYFGDTNSIYQQMKVTK